MRKLRIYLIILLIIGWAIVLLPRLNKKFFSSASRAQAHKKEGDIKKYILNLERARKLDPENDVLKEEKI